MRRQRLLIVPALCALACAQIAGFEQLTSKSQATDGGTGGHAGSPVTSSGTSTGADSTGGTETVAAAGANGEMGDAGNSGNSSSAAGNATTGGTGASAGSGPSAGNGPSAGSGGSEVVGGCNAQQLRNANFDAGPAVGWDDDSTDPVIKVMDLILAKGDVRLTTAQVAPKSDDYLAWLGGHTNTDQGTRVNLLQDVQIPEDTSSLVVSGWIRILTDEPIPSDSNDHLDLALQDEEDNFWSFHAWYATDANDQWQSFEYRADSLAVLGELRGRTLTFIAESKANTEHDTHFWLDSLSLVAECP